MPSHPEIICHIENIPISPDLAIPLGIIVNELITNSLKHAMSKINDGTISIEVKKVLKDRIVLHYKDNGKSYSPSPVKKEPGYGLNLINLLVKQIKGTVSFPPSSSFDIAILFPFSID